VKKLMIGVSGIRGVVGETFTPELITRLGAAFGTYANGGRIIVGRDTRVSGEMVKHALLGGLISTGCRVIDIGICPTPTLTIMINELKADGGVMISASHNPIEWNALKFYQPTGVIMDEDEGREFLSIYYLGDFDYKAYNGIHDVTTDASAPDRHLARIYAVTDVAAIRARRPKVVIDACNGAGAIITPRMLEHLGCEVVQLHCTPDGMFPHNPEPVFQNLQDLAATVRAAKADLGFAQDADADRIALVDEQGTIVGEEMSLALAVAHVLGRNKGPVVTNMSTSRVIDDICRAAGAPLVRTAVGEVHVAQKMLELGAVIGGEGNGGVINPPVGTGRDSLAAMALVLELCAGAGKPLSAIVAGFPAYRIDKEVVECPRGLTGLILRKLEERYTAAGAALDVSDGLKVNWSDSWVHIRRSNTEPVVRVIAEAPTLEGARRINAEVRDAMRALIRGAGADA
jgi:phosphomannomutase